MNTACPAEKLLKKKVGSIAAMLMAFVLTSCDDGKLQTAYEETIDDESKFRTCQEACVDDKDCAVDGKDVDLFCVDNRCIFVKCKEDDDCQDADTTHPICDLSTFMCVCGPDTCKEGRPCLNNGKCGCASDLECLKMDDLHPICDLATGQCRCTDQSCKQGYTCLAEQGTCGCEEDATCEAWGWEGDICFKGQCGCLDVDGCDQKTKFDGTTRVCE